MDTQNKKKQDMSIEEILGSIRNVIEKNDPIKNDREDVPKLKIEEDVLELTEIAHDRAVPLIKPVREGSNISKLRNPLSSVQDDKLVQYVEHSQKDKKSKSLTVEELLVEIMKPQIKEWLDKNLNTIAQQLLEKELKRVMFNRKE